MLRSNTYLLTSCWFSYIAVEIPIYVLLDQTDLGKVFEDIAKHFLIDLKPINFNKIGKWWHKDKEIDIIAINEQTKEMLAVEVKWQDLKLRDVKSIIKELQEKLPYVQWHNDKRKEILGIFAKKVDKKAREWLVSNGYKVWDLEDIKKIYVKNHMHYLKLYSLFNAFFNFLNLFFLYNLFKLCSL